MTNPSDYPSQDTNYQPNPYDTFDQPFQPYPQPSPYGHAPTLVKITAIFNIIMASLDILYALFFLLIAILIATGNTTPEDNFLLPERPAPVAPDPNDAPLAFIVGFVLVIGLFPAIAGILKLTAGIKLLRGKPRAWGFALAAGIVGCLQFWWMYFCVFPLAVGIFTIIVMCLQSVRNYLRSRAAAASPTSS